MITSPERELDVAGISGAQLRWDYLECRELNSTHGTSYYLATLLMPAAKRPAVHALYGFARWVDDLIDEADPPVRVDEQIRLLTELRRVFAGDASDAANAFVAAAPVRAVLDTISRWGIPRSHFLAFLDSMELDLTVTEYETYADLERYMWGSAAVIGLQMLPILEPTLPAAIAAPYAIDLGIAFQLTNFLRDIGEDLRRGRIYLPQESLRQHGVDRERLLRGVVDGPIRRLLTDEIARTREIYRSAAMGVRLLNPTSQPCVRTALRLYSGILDEIERGGYDVLQHRARVGVSRRMRLALPGLVSAAHSRRTEQLPIA